MPFVEVALFFQSKILQCFAASLEKQYGIYIDLGYSKHKLTSILESRLRQIGTQPFKEYIIEAEVLRQEINMAAGQGKTFTPEEE